MTTVLEITQSILSDMSGDDVNSIFDTEEAEQVARIVVSTFNAMVSRSTWPTHRRLVQLVSPADNSVPTHMTFTSNIKELCTLSYDKVKSGETKKAYVELIYKSPDDFLRLLNVRDSTATTTQIVTDVSGVELLIANNSAPTYYTSFDDTTVIFDSFDIAVDSTLLAAKVQAMAYIQPTLSLLDIAEPDLPPDALPALIEEATVRSQHKVAEFRDVTSEREAGRQNRWISRKAWRTNKDARYPDYGRK